MQARGNTGAETQSGIHMVPEHVYFEDSSEGEQRNHKTQEGLMRSSGSRDGVVPTEMKPPQGSHCRDASTLYNIIRLHILIPSHSAPMLNSTFADLHTVRKPQLSEQAWHNASTYNTLNQNFTAKQHIHSDTMSPEVMNLGFLKII